LPANRRVKGEIRGLTPSPKTKLTLHQAPKRRYNQFLPFFLAKSQGNAKGAEAVGKSLLAFALSVETCPNIISLIVDKAVNMRHTNNEVIEMPANTTYKPKLETIALIDRIESGEEKLARFNSVEELLSDLNSEDDDDE